MSKCYKLKILIFEIIKLIWSLSDQISEWNAKIWRIFTTEYKKKYKDFLMMKEFKWLDKLYFIYGI